ncbi:YtzH-like family protein [Peribacillus kribbensis]|uniref:YtzH-like family protein n=1 Tax=Peribacillus kribbensis TaxID=356658 RepID=UPI0004177E3A|nr:YtzH-like family protein [Peribacillus kribbensis]
MPLSCEHQMSLLTDILNDHQTDCCGSVAECEQLERLIKSLMVNANIDTGVKTILEEVYRYSQNGRNSTDLDGHILSHQSQISQWIEDIGQFS